MKKQHYAVLAALLLLSGPAAPSRAANDQFGVVQMYPTTSGGKQWAANWGGGQARTFTWGDDPLDSWTHGRGNATYSIDGQGQLLLSGSTPRLYIYNPGASGWRNVEMTVYAMRVSDSGTAYGGIVGIARTNHTADTTNLCDTRGIGARFRYDGRIDLEKETSHPNSVPIKNKTHFSGGMPKNTWIGWKYVVYDLPNGNVKIENYMDLTDGANGGTWVKVNEHEDNGSNFGVGGKACKSGIDPAMRLNAGDSRTGSETGKPNLAVYFRSDNVGTNGLKYKRMSVREITPGGSSDTTAPVLSGVAASGIGQNSATIAWTTNEPSDTQVEYGPTSSYGSASPLAAAQTTAHSAALSGLSAGTVYHYRVKSRDAAGNLATSANATFTTAATPPPPPPPPAAGCYVSAGTWQNAAFGAQTGPFTVSFDAVPGTANMDGVSGLSNGAASGYAALAAAVRFNNTGSIDARNGAAYAAAAAIPYSAGLTYRFRLVVDLAARKYSAYVRQGTGTEKLIGNGYSFRTEQAGAGRLDNLGLLASSGNQTACAVTAAALPPPDTTAPVLSGVAASAIGQNSATIAWTTNEPSDTQVEYGPTSSYGSASPLAAALTTAHSAALSGLSAGTVYHYRVKSRDAAGNLATSANASFTTAAAPPPPPPPPAAGCYVSAGTWQNAAFGAQTGPFTVSFDAVPGTANMDGVSGLSNGAASGYTALAAAVRFNNTGAIDARNGAAYAAAAAIPYVSGLTYRFRLVVDLATRKYSAYVRQGAGTEQLIGSGYSFRTEQAGAGRLDNLGLFASAGSETACALTAAALPPPDTTAPVLSGATSSGIGQSSATIAWTTDEPADTQVEYGPTASYGSASPLVSALTTSHSAALSGLNTGAVYQYRVKSRDAAGNLATSANGSFTTASAPPPPPPGGACITSAGTWQNSALGGQTGAFTVSYDATPAIARMDGVSGLSNGAASGYASLAAAVRFNNSGFIDARDGAAYAAAAAIPYSAGLAYRIRLVVDLAARKYSAYVRQGNGTEQLVGSGYSFRSEQSAATRLDNLGLMASSGSETACAATTTASAGPGAAGGTLTENFQNYPLNTCMPDGATFGPWRSAYAGYGCTQVKTDGSMYWLEESPTPSLAPEETHASMVVGPSFGVPLDFSVSLNTIAQLRQNNPPNAWETAWVVWNYTDDEHFYYLAPKPNGWELGKRDPAYPGGQRFLATGPSPAVPIGAWTNVRILQNLDTMTVSINGQTVTTFTDTERPYNAGSVALYNEDATVRFTNVSVNVGGTGLTAGFVPALGPGDLARAPQKFLSPALADGINDVAAFGIDAEEVNIYSVAGHEVFRGSRQGGPPIVWDAKDGSGRVRESGVYVAKIKRVDSKVLYQSFALVK
ncbi:MAG: fibronectin type III domain-containing protein [Elusimicrobia bacterium]|nr:fibronectin type III domain-containing protein [Elusimicrobiota bacterium]